MSLFLGIDAGTQNLKCIVIDTSSGRVAAETSINYGIDLPQYGEPDGFIPDPDPLVRHADPLMWLDALELALVRLGGAGVDMAAIKGISGSAQQHGSVYLSCGVPMLSEVPGATLAEKMRPLLSRRTSPIWMDRSTSRECLELETRFGARIRSRTGSPAVERFTGPQIRKFAKDDPAAYENTKRIHLVSSFLCSVLTGGNAPVDPGDGAGMNMLDLASLHWDGGIAPFTAPGLMRKLPHVEASAHTAGRLDNYFQRFGFSPGIPVTVFSGDNPNSLVGTGTSARGTAGISLGTSDTFFAPMPVFKTDPEGYGHVFGNPAGGFMSLTCFTNGSLARETLRKSFGVSRDYFDREALEITSPGAYGRFFLPYFSPESTPLVLNPGVRKNYSSASPAEEIRALLETQAVSMKCHSAWLGETFSRIRITGGASASEGFRKIIADVFQADVETVAVSDSAGLGAAMRAANTVENISFDELSEMFCGSVSVTHPDPVTAGVYAALEEEFPAFEKKA